MDIRDLIVEISCPKNDLWWWLLSLSKNNKIVHLKWSTLMICKIYFKAVKGKKKKTWVKKIIHKMRSNIRDKKIWVTLNVS